MSDPITMTVPRSKHIYDLKPGDEVAVDWPYNSPTIYRVSAVVSETVLRLDYPEIYLAHRIMRELFIWGTAMFAAWWTSAMMWSLLWS